MIKELAQKYNTSVASIICAALSSFEVPEVYPVIGGSRVEQIKDSLSGGDIKIDNEELKRIFKFDI